MGYSTDFEGSIEIDPPLNDEQISEINKFFGERHEGFGSSFPAIWCDFEVSEDGTNIFWNESEKSYNMDEWMVYLINNFFSGHILNGKMEALGEDPNDRWLLHVRDNRVYVEDIMCVPNGSEQYIGGAPETIALPDDSGLRVLNHIELGEYIGDFLKDLGGDAPEEVVTVFKSLFDYPIAVNEDGTFTIDEDI